MKKILLFASGTGSNVENIIRYFKNNDNISIVGIFTNNPHAKVLEIAKHHNISSFVFDRTALNEGLVLEKINHLQPDLIILAGFLWKMPETIVHRFHNKIINIHPALLPKYGGKGMYGIKVHQTILENNENETGITIHYVNEHYDEGEFILQKTVNITDCDSAEAVARKVQQLEHEHFPKVIEQILNPKS